MIHITRAAQKHFSKLLENHKLGTQIRVFVENPGTYDAECYISYCPQDEVQDSDTALQFEQVIAYVDVDSAHYLHEAEIDLITNGLSSQLIITAPNIKTSTISDDSPMIDRVNHVIQSQINPQLAAHGGHVTLIKITDNNIAVLQFSGGCKGCSMVDYTLKNNIEEKLLEKVPELKGVIDLTTHTHDEHSYY